MDIRLRTLPRQYKYSIAVIILLALLIQLLLCWRWSREPSLYLEYAGTASEPVATGQATPSALIATIDWLLEKPGGYLRNDVYLPGKWLDNMPNFEIGVLRQARDLVKALRSADNADLAAADLALNRADDSWLFPRTEGALSDARDALREYRNSLESGDFDANAASLRSWLGLVERELAALSAQLAAANDADPAERTPWLHIDDVFFQARGAAWAILQYLNAARSDYAVVLTETNATASLRAAVRELEAALQPLRTPAIMNGGGYGLFANHSLMLGARIARAQAAVVELRAQLEPVQASASTQAGNVRQLAASLRSSSR